MNFVASTSTSMTTTRLVWLFLLLASHSSNSGMVSFVNCFSIVQTTKTTHRHWHFARDHSTSSLSPFRRTSSSTRLQASLLFTPDQVESIELGRTAFFIWFFGASGAGGIALGAFPRMYQNYKATMELKDDNKVIGDTAATDTIGINARLCGYPNDLRRSDVDRVLAKSVSVERIVQQNPVEGNFLADKGYLTFAAFQQHNQKENPLVVRAMFDSLNTNTDVCNPDTAQIKLDSYRKDLSTLKSELLKARLQGFAAIFTLVALLLLAGYEALCVFAVNGWFPGWPGLEHLPGSLLDPETGLAALPMYFYNDDPSASATIMN